MSLLTSKIVLPAVQSARDSRRNFLRRSAMVTLAGSAAAAVVLPRKARADEVAAPDDSEASTFYQIRQHENFHVKFLVDALGANARPRPLFNNVPQSSIEEFLETSQALENTGVGAYLGALPYIDSREYIAAAGSIALIEARHAGFLNNLEGDPITASILDLTQGQNLETPLTADQVDDLAGPFIKSLNGGPPITYDQTISPENDIAILNFALALEYLEAFFYNYNVPRLFGPNPDL